MADHRILIFSLNGNRLSLVADIPPPTREQTFGPVIPVAMVAPNALAVTVVDKEGYSRGEAVNPWTCIVRWKAGEGK